LRAKDSEDWSLESEVFFDESARLKTLKGIKGPTNGSPESILANDLPWGEGLGWRIWEEHGRSALRVQDGVISLAILGGHVLPGLAARERSIASIDRAKHAVESNSQLRMQAQA
jgi:hypothetical protein